MTLGEVWWQDKATFPEELFFICCVLWVLKSLEGSLLIRMEEVRGWRPHLGLGNNGASGFQDQCLMCVRAIAGSPGNGFEVNGEDEILD